MYTRIITIKRYRYRERGTGEDRMYEGLGWDGWKGTEYCCEYKASFDFFFQILYMVYDIEDHTSRPELLQGPTPKSYSG